MSATSDREQRLFLQNHPVDIDKKGNLRFLDGQLREGVIVEGLKLTLDFSRVYPDDAIAVIREMYSYLNTAYPSHWNEQILGHLREAIYTADKRAVERHGYSFSPVERDLKLPSDY